MDKMKNISKGVVFGMRYEQLFALVFFVSDFIYLTGKYILKLEPMEPQPGMRPQLPMILVMSSYYLALLLITMSALSTYPCAKCSLLFCSKPKAN